MRATTVLASALMVAAANAADGKCRALALSGGANHGSYEVGVMWGLVNYGNPDDFAWNVVTGVSAGAINTAATAVFATGDEANMVDFLTACWANLTSGDIWQFWPDVGIVGEAAALFNKPGMLDTSPAIAYLARITEPYGALKKMFTVSAVDANTGEYQTFDQTNIEFSELPQAAFASGSIPVAFPPQHFHGYVLMDGGTVWDVNIDSAVNQCLDSGFAEEDIIMDVIICGYSAKAEHTVGKDAIHNWQQAEEVRNFYASTNSIQQSMRAYPNVEKRYYIQERDTGCHVPNMLDFNNSTTWCLQEAGRRDAQKFLDLGQEALHNSLEKWDNDQDLQEEYPGFRSYLAELFGI